MKKELQKKEHIRIKCPLCTSKIPSTSLRCSKCSGDLGDESNQNNIQAQIKKQTNMAAIKVLIFIIVFGIIVISFMTGDSSTPTTQTKQNTNKTLRIGDTGILNNNTSSTDCSGSTGVAVTSEALDAYIRTQTIEDKEGFLLMIGNGEIFFVDNCTSVRRIDTSGVFASVAEVRILDGLYSGDTGWVPYEFAVKE